MNPQEIARLGLIVVAACVFIFIIQSYNNGNNNVPQNNGNNSNNVRNVAEDAMEGFYADGEATQDAPNANSYESGAETVTESEDEPQASEGDGNENETFKTVDNEVAENQAANNNNNNNNNESGNRLPNECYPKDVLTPQDLLPQDANSTWAQTVPNGQGNLGDQNFLNAGFHVGINTVGQSLRNANLQLRSEPPNPQLKVSPWLQTTIEPDANRKAFEIGEQ